MKAIHPAAPGAPDMASRRTKMEVRRPTSTPRVTHSREERRGKIGTGWFFATNGAEKEYSRGHRGEAQSKGKPKALASPRNPWIIDPQHYKIKFEYSEVQVTRGRIGPKEGTPLHEHSLNRVFVYLTKDGLPRCSRGKKSEHAVQKECAAAWGTPIRHRECNLSGKRFEAVVIEAKY